LLPVAVRQLGEPVLDAWGHRFDARVGSQHEQSGRVGPLGVGRLADQQPATGTFGEVGGQLKQEGKLVGVELRASRLAVEADRRPRHTIVGAQTGPELLLGAEGLDGHPIPAAAAGVPAGRFVKRGHRPISADDVGQLVEVVFQVLDLEPLARNLGQAGIEVARHQQRGRIERPPAGKEVVGNGAPDEFRRLTPERDGVKALSCESRDPLFGALLCVRAHGPDRTPRMNR
jgi:hypothetical protein